MGPAQPAPDMPEGIALPEPLAELVGSGRLR